MEKHSQYLRNLIQSRYKFMPKFFNICTKKTFVVGGIEKSRWPIVGTLKELDNGKKFIELNILPNESFYVFEQENKQKTHDIQEVEQQKSLEESLRNADVNVEDSDVSVENIPF